MKPETKNLIKSVITGEQKRETLTEHLLETYPVNALVEMLSILLIENQKEKISPIPISRQEYERIISLFSIRGERKLNDGTIIQETRGRKKKEDL